MKGQVVPSAEPGRRSTLGAPAAAEGRSPQPGNGRAVGFPGWQLLLRRIVGGGPYWSRFNPAFTRSGGAGKRPVSATHSWPSRERTKVANSLTVGAKGRPGARFT